MENIIVPTPSQTSHVPGKDMGFATMARRAMKAGHNTPHAIWMYGNGHGMQWTLKQAISARLGVLKAKRMAKKACKAKKATKPTKVNTPWKPADDATFKWKLLDDEATPPVEKVPVAVEIHNDGTVHLNVCPVCQANLAELRSKIESLLRSYKDKTP